MLDKYSINCFTEPIGEARVKTNSLCRGALTLQLRYHSKDTTKEPAYAGTLHCVVEVSGHTEPPQRLRRVWLRGSRREGASHTHTI